MKLLRHGPKGMERPGVLDRDGNIRDLTGVAEDYTPQFFAADGIAALRNIELDKLPLVAKGTRVGPCVARTGNFIAIGLNYVQHARETNSPIPPDPIIFNKAPSCISGPDDPVVLPRDSVKSDWEVELAFVIGKKAHYVEESKALEYVAGYCVCNDVSERAYQLERSGQWVKGKIAPTFGPLGPWLVTPDEISDVQNMRLWLDLNGKRIQDSSTSDMIFTIARIIADTSQYVLLEPGDVITTGTPPGVGLGMKPPRFLKAGDTMRLGIDGLGVQEQVVLHWDDHEKAGLGR